MSLSNFIASLKGGQAPSAAPAPTATAALAANALSPAPAGDSSSSNPAMQPGQGAAPADPMAAWAEMFKPATASVAAGDVKVPAAPDLWNVNPEQLAKAAQGINLSSVVPQELMQKALGGDAASFMEVINKSSQMTFMMAYQAAMQGVKPAMDARFDAFSKEMPSTFKQLSVDATLQGDPLLSNPAMQPVVSSVRAQILAKHPDATPQQIQQAISEYLKSVGISMAPPSAAANIKQGSSKEVDWDNFLVTPK